MGLEVGTASTVVIEFKAVGPDQVKADFASVGAAGEASAKRVADAGQAGATKFSQAFVANAVKAREAATAFASMFEQQFKADEARISEGLARGIITREQARKAGQEAAQAYNQGLLGQLDKLGSTGLNVGNSPQYAELASSLKAVGDVSVRTGVNINTVRASFTSMAASALGAAPGVTQLSSALGAMALGTGVTVGVLAAVAAISFAYEALTAQSKKAKEEQKKLTDALGEWYDKERQGPTGVLEAQIGAEIKLLAQLRTALDNTTKGKTFSDIPEFLKDVTKAYVLGSFNPAEANKEFEKLWTQYVQGQKATIAKGAAEIKAAARAAYENLITSSYDVAEKQGGNLSTLIGGRNATGGQQADAAALLQKERAALVELQQQYGTLTDAKAKAFNLDLQTRAFNGITQLEGAAHTALLDRLKDIQNEQALAVHVLDAVTESILKQIAASGEAIRAGAATNADALRQSEQSAVLARTEGDAHEHLANQYKAENAVIEANRTLSGIALRERLDTIAAVRRQGDEVIRLATLQKQLGEATAIAAKNEASTKKELSDGLKENLAPIQELQRGFERDFSRAVSNGLKDGFSSLHGLLESASRTFDDFASRAIAMKVSGALFEKLDANGKQIHAGIFDIADQKQLQKFAIAAVAVNAVADALNSLTGAASLTVEAINQRIIAFITLQKSVDAYRLQVTGTPLQQSLAQNTAQADTLRGQIEVALPGKQLEAERERQLGIVTALEAARNAQLRAESAILAVQATEDYKVRTLRAQGLTAEADALEFSEKQQREYNAAVKQFGADATDTLAALKEAQDAEKAKRDADLAAAAAADAATAAANAHADSLAAEAAAAQKAADALAAFTSATEALAAALAAGPQGTIDSQQASGLQPLLDKQTADLGAYAQAAATYASDVANSADPFKTASDYYALLTAGVVLAGDAAAIAAKAFQDAAAKIDAGTSQIEQDVANGFTSGSQGIAQEAQNFGFTGLTPEEVKALYKPFDADNPLSNQDAENNKHIITYLEDLKKWIPAIADSTATTAANAPKASGETNAIANAAHALTESTGNRMADYLASENIILKEIRDILKLGHAFNANPIAVPPMMDFSSVAPALDFSAFNYQPPSRSRQQNANERAPTPAASGDQRPIVIQIIVQQAEGESDDTFVGRIADKVDEELGNRYVDRQQRDGNPLVTGA